MNICVKIIWRNYWPIVKDSVKNVSIYQLRCPISCVKQENIIIVEGTFLMTRSTITVSTWGHYSCWKSFGKPWRSSLILCENWNFEFFSRFRLKSWSQNGRRSIEVKRPKIQVKTRRSPLVSLICELINLSLILPNFRFEVLQINKLLLRPGFSCCGSNLDGFLDSCIRH